MRKMWVVAAREYRATVKTKAFMIALIIMPIFMFGGIFVQKFMEGRVENEAKRVAVIDQTGKLYDALYRAAAGYNERVYEDDETDAKPAKSEPKRQVRPKIELSEVSMAGNDLDKLRLEQSDRVRRKEIYAFIELASDALTRAYDPKSTDAPIKYYSNEPTNTDIQRWLAREVNGYVQSARLEKAGIKPAIVRAAMVPVDVANLGLFTRGVSGAIVQAKEVNEAVTVIVPIALIMLMWMAIIMTTQPILQGVIEEKMQKISEVMLGSVRPFDLMMGKLLGFVGVSITLVGIYMVGGYFFASRQGYADAVPFHLLGWFIVFQCLAILMFGSLFLAVGSCCNDIREAQSLVMPVFLVMIIPFMALGTVMRHPSSQFSMLLSLFPPATPMVMIMRLSIPPGVPLWQPLVGIAGLLVSTLICVWAAGRIFRIGLLVQGKAPKLPEILRWVVTG